MLSAIVQDLITKEEEYLYLKIENNNLIYYGYSIQNRNVKQIDRDIINKIYNLLRVNENCVYIEDYQDYKVYLDKDNNIKHYLKNGVEDFFMLFKNNGEDSNLYLKIEYENISKNSNSKKFKIGNKILRITLESLKSFIIGILIGTVIVGVVNDTPRTVKHEINNLIYSTYQAFNLDVEAIDTYQAYQLINESKLPLSTKQSLNNKDLLDDVFPYYEDTNMQYSIKNRLKDL